MRMLAFVMTLASLGGTAAFAADLVFPPDAKTADDKLAWIDAQLKEINVLMAPELAKSKDQWDWRIIEALVVKGRMLREAAEKVRSDAGRPQVGFPTTDADNAYDEYATVQAARAHVSSDQDRQRREAEARKRVGWNEPQDFRGAQFGAPMAEAWPILSGPVRASGRLVNSCAAGSTHCFMTFMIGPVITNGTAIFRDGAFSGVDLRFKSGSYETLRAIFVERYGEPTARGTEEFKTKGGLTGQNEILDWKGEQVAIRLQTYSSTIEDGSASILTKREIERRAQDAAKAIKKGKDDL